MKEIDQDEKLSPIGKSPSAQELKSISVKYVSSSDSVRIELANEEQEETV